MNQKDSGEGDVGFVRRLDAEGCRCNSITAAVGLIGTVVAGIILRLVDRYLLPPGREKVVVPARREDLQQPATESAPAVEEILVESPQAGEAETAERRKEVEPVAASEEIPIGSPQAGEAETAERRKEVEPVTALEAIPIESRQAEETGIVAAVDSRAGLGHSLRRGAADAGDADDVARPVGCHFLRRQFEDRSQQP